MSPRHTRELTVAVPQLHRVVHRNRWVRGRSWPTGPFFLCEGSSKSKKGIYIGDKIEVTKQHHSGVGPLKAAKLLQISLYWRAVHQSLLLKRAMHHFVIFWELSDISVQNLSTAVSKVAVKFRSDDSKDSLNRAIQLRYVTSTCYITLFS